MKKCITALMLTAVMMVFAACGGSGSDAPVVGEWKMTQIEAMGVTVSVDEYMEAMGGDAEDMDMKMTIKGDGTFTGKIDNEESDGTWEYKEPSLTLNADGESMDCEYKDGKLTMSIEEDGQTFSAVFEK